MQNEPDRPLARPVTPDELVATQSKALQRLISRSFKPRDDVHVIPFREYVYRDGRISNEQSPSTLDRKFKMIIGDVHSLREIESVRPLPVRSRIQAEHLAFLFP